MPERNPHSNLSRYNIGEALNAQIGQNGFELISNTSANTTGYNCIYIVADATFSAIAGTGISGSPSGFTFTAGMVVFGNITSFTLSSGKVLAYISGVPA